MKKIAILSLFIIGLLIQITANECIVIKSGQNMTIYNVEDAGNTNYWGTKVKITKTETILPNDIEAKDLGLPEEDWLSFSENVNGVYSSRFEKLQKDFKQLQIQHEDDLIAKNLTIITLLLLMALILIIKIGRK